jgi:hypothetical protein
MGAVEVELLVVADCPNEAGAVTLVQSALRDIGLPDIEVLVNVIRTQYEAERRGFLGSPTIMINGDDPFAEAGQTPALACRIYIHANGPSALPDLRLLRQALKRAAANHR